MTDCASNSRTRLDNGKPAKLFWHTKGRGGELSEIAREISYELSNLLRISR